MPAHIIVVTTRLSVLPDKNLYFSSLGVVNTDVQGSGEESVERRDSCHGEASTLEERRTLYSGNINSSESESEDSGSDDSESTNTESSVCENQCNYKESAKSQDFVLTSISENSVSSDNSQSSSKKFGSMDCQFADRDFESSTNGENSMHENLETSEGNLHDNLDEIPSAQPLRIVNKAPSSPGIQSNKRTNYTEDNSLSDLSDFEGIQSVFRPKQPIPGAVIPRVMGRLSLSGRRAESKRHKSSL